MGSGDHGQLSASQVEPPLPTLVYAVLSIASSLKVTRTRGCVQAANVHNVYTILHMETSSTNAPATIPTAHTEKQVD